MKQFKNIAIAAIATLTIAAGSASASQIDESFDRAFSTPEQGYSFAPVVASFDRLLTEPQSDNFFYVRTAYSRLIGQSVSQRPLEPRSEMTLAYLGWEDVATQHEMVSKSLVAQLH